MYFSSQNDISDVVRIHNPGGERSHTSMCVG